MTVGKHWGSGCGPSQTLPADRNSLTLSWAVHFTAPTWWERKNYGGTRITSTKWHPGTPPPLSTTYSAAPWPGSKAALRLAPARLAIGRYWRTHAQRKARRC